MNALNFSVEHLGLPAQKPAALKDWYVSALGAQVVFDNGQQPPAYFLRLNGGLMIEIYASNSSRTETADNSLAGWRHVALRVANVEAARDELTRRGVQFTQPIKPAGGGGRVLFFNDPEGNLLHLIDRPADSPLK